MARRRKFDPTPAARGEIRAYIQRGMTNAEALQTIRERYPRVNANKLRQEVARERRSQESIERIGSINQGQFVNLGRILGCEDTAAPIRSRFTVTFSDPSSGQPKQFAYTVEMGSRGRLVDIINAALEQVRREANRRGSPFPTVSALRSDPNFNLSMDYLRCLGQ